MTPDTEHDELVMTIVTAALKQPTQDRDAFLRLACKGNEELYREAAEAVTFEQRMGGFLLHPIVVLEDPVRSLSSGQIVSDRFEIVRKIGDGGMGVVYEAQDLKRHQRIALKFSKAGFQRLLSPELEGALKVRHPNICLVNQIHTASIEDSEVDFLAMEFVKGETLSHRLEQVDKTPQSEALEIARQLCAGIAEAHRSGIIHRDLKSGNIMLCRTDNEGLRVVIMDFGLAGAVALDSTEGGTPGYLAPELSKGEKASVASDIYALGVILYQIVTGRMPMKETPADPGKPGPFAAPSSLSKGLDPRWDQVILSCLEASPALRPSDAQRVIAALEKKPFPKVLSLVTVFVAALLVAGTLSIPSVRDRIWPPANVRLAILPFEGPTDSPEMGGGVQSDVSERIRHMSGGRRNLAVIPASEMTDRQIVTSGEALKVLHATHVLQVKLSHEGGELVAQCRVIDLATQTTLKAFEGRYSSVTVGNMPAALAGSVSLALGLNGPAVPETLSPAATPAYDRGLYLLRRDQESYEDAVASFGDAARLDPRSALPLAGLVEAEVMKSKQRNQPEALDVARQALEAAESLSPDLPRVRLAAGLLEETAGQYEEALDDYRRVLNREPQDVDALRSIAGVYDKLKMPSQAIAAYQKAIQLDPGYYAGYHGLGVFYYYHGDYAKAAEQFQMSIERAPGLFEEYTNLGAALDDLGRDAEAEKALLTSLKLHETARALNSMGALRAYQKRDGEAVAYYKRTLALDPNDYTYEENLADAERRLGRMQDATAAYLKARDLAQSVITKDPRNGMARGYLAYVSARLGDRNRAEAEIAQALLMSRGETKVGSSRVDLQACKLEYSIVSPK